MQCFMSTQSFKVVIKIFLNKITKRRHSSQITEGMFKIIFVNNLWLATLDIARTLSVHEA